MSKTTQVLQRVVECNGGNDLLGHPRVFLKIYRNKTVICPYCRQKFHYRET